jgi:DNA gyrase subunit A
MMAVKSGRAIRFPEAKVRSTGRGAIGVGGIDTINASDEVVGMICVNPTAETQKTVLVVSENGYGKRTTLDAYRITNRGGKGVKTINVTDKTGKLVGLLDVEEKDDLMITCKSGVTIRMNVGGISELGRATQGVKLIRLDEGDAIAAITCINEKDVEEVVEEIVEEKMVEREIIEEKIIEEKIDSGENNDATNEEENSSDENTEI